MSRPCVPEQTAIVILACSIAFAAIASTHADASSKSERKSETPSTLSEAKKKRAMKAAAAPAIALCPMQISNPPPVDPDGFVDRGPVVAIRSVSLLLAPATDVCFSSGYGSRNGKLHRGVDYHAKTNGNALAAGGGVILEAVTRTDYGNMIVIDHGDKVYTRYAHLASFAAGIKEGATIKQGDLLGPIGATGATTVKHLHYEIMSGAYVTGVGTFGLSTFNPIDLPAAKSGTKARKGA
jgi:murein DD-endopeptidase MepM/ murein hydrolase activator NlpD